jgi:hypothetical protein
MALEGRVRAGERNFSEAQEKEFDESDGAPSEYGGMYERNAESPEDRRTGEADGD